MFCSQEDAFALFIVPWRANSTEVLLSIDRGVGGSEFCKIDWVSPGNGTLISIVLTRSGVKKILDVRDAQFSFEDARAGIVPELVAKRWSSFLLAEFPNGRSLLFAEPLSIG